MNKLTIISSVITLALGACATTQSSSLPYSGRGSSVALDLEPSGADVQRAALVRQSIALLPSADRIRNVLRTEGHETLTASIRMCVAPDGSAAGVELLRTSGAPSFDAALVRDAAAWEFDSYAAPRTVKVCEPVTITYNP